MALALLREFGGANGGGLAAPSANRFGAVSPTEAWHVRTAFGIQVDQVLDGGPCRFGLESTIVSLLDDRPRVLRPGALPLSALREVLGVDAIEYAKQADSASTSTPRVPGALAAHYAPATPLEILSMETLPARATALLDQGFRIAVLRRNQNMRSKGLPPTLPQFLLSARPETYARSLYARLREFDQFGFDRVLVEAPPDDETWWAINDRLARAASAHRLVPLSVQESP